VTKEYLPFLTLPDFIQPREEHLFSLTKRLVYDQEQLQLKNEVVQYQIKFHKKDVVNVSVSMYLRYLDRTISSAYFLLTNGEKPLLRPAYICIVPERKYVLVTPLLHLSFGRFFVKSLLDKWGKIFFGSGGVFSQDLIVNEGDVWYLTMAVPTTADRGIYSVVFTSRNESMEASQITRHNKLGLFAADYHQFSGKYYAVKLGLFGFSICNVNTEVSTATGSIILMTTAGHTRGSMTVRLANGSELKFSQRGLMILNYIGNQTGDWSMNVKAFSWVYKMMVLFLYIDVNPFCKEFFFK
jgi:hypothetical protein